MAAQFVVAYRKPADPAAFDRYYFENHIPLAKTIPGLRRYLVSRGPVVAPEGASPFHLMAVLSFDSVADIQKAFVSPQGQAAVADVQKFAGAGVEMNFFEAVEV
jgi:uncharacterized protein (TIGR02118 family)